MTEKGSIADPASDPVPGTPPKLTGKSVAAYLRAHPNFLAERPELLDDLRAPGREKGNVLDLQQAMIERLRMSNGQLRDEQDAIIHTARDNQAIQARVHEAVLAMIAARSFEQLIQVVSIDLQVMLDLDAVTICMEAGDATIPKAYARAVRSIPNGFVDQILGPGENMLLETDTTGEVQLFGSAAGLVRSQALARLKVSRQTPVGLLALGSRWPEKFDRGQSTEFLNFLARVAEITIRQWLNLPA